MTTRYASTCVTCGEVLFVSDDRPARADVERVERHARGHVEGALPLSPASSEDPVAEILAQLEREWGGEAS